MITKINKLFAGCILCCGLTAAFTACSKNDPDIPNLYAAQCPASIEFQLPDNLQQLLYVDEADATVLPLIKGETVKLAYSMQPADITFRQVQWSSSNPVVATVADDGTVTAVSGAGIGYSMISISPVGMFSGSGVISTLKVRVSDELIKTTSITVDLSSSEVYAGETVQAIATILPAEATYRTVKWSSSDESVAKVDINGVVTGQPSAPNNAKVTITATALDGSGVSASAPLTVKQVVQPQRVTIDAAYDGLDLAIASKALTLNYTTIPDDCTKSLIEWSSSDENIATVKDGVVTFNQTGNFGEFTITASCPETGQKSSVKMTLAAGLIRELYKDPNNLTWKDAGQSGNGSSTSTVWHDGYVTITTYNQNATNQRADIKGVTPAWLHAGNYPIFAIKMDDVKDKYEEITSRNINFDAVGKGMLNGLDYKSIGGGNNKYSSNYLCSDGSRVFIYDLSTVACRTGGLLPTDQAVQFSVFQLKYADMRTIDHQVTYNIYWVQTFKTMDDLKKYLTEVDGVTFE